MEKKKKPTTQQLVKESTAFYIASKNFELVYT